MKNRKRGDQMSIEDLSESTKEAIGKTLQQKIIDRVWYLKIDTNFEHKITGLIYDLASTKIGPTEALAALIGCKAALELTDLAADLEAVQRGIVWERDEHRLA